MKRVFHWVWNFLDPLIVTVAGGVCFVLGLVGVLEQEALSTVTLGILTAAGATLLRTRLGLDATHEVLGQLEPSVAGLREKLDEAPSDSPWIVVRNEVRFDLEAADGSRAVMRRGKRFRFTQNGILAVTEHVWAEGTSDVKVKSPHKVVDEISHHGRTYKVISLCRVCGRGDEEWLDVERVDHDSFLKPNEHLTMLTEEETKHTVLRVVWPAERPPTALRLEEPNTAARSVLDQLRDENGRPAYEYRTDNPPKGEVTIRWSW